jgi:hypothetical protein
VLLLLVLCLDLRRGVEGAAAAAAMFGLEKRGEVMMPLSLPYSDLQSGGRRSYRCCCYLDPRRGEGGGAAAAVLECERRGEVMVLPRSDLKERG